MINKCDHPKEILNRMALSVIEKSNKCQIRRKFKHASAKEIATGTEH